MNDLRLFLFDDRHARRWAPFTLTRPVGELLCGCFTARERAERVFGVACQGHLTRRALVGFDEPGAAPGIATEVVGEAGTRILLSSRAVPALTEVEMPSGSARILVAGQPVGWILEEGAPLPSESWLRDPAGAPAEGPDITLEGVILSRPWDLVARNPEQITQDVAALSGASQTPPGVTLIGDGGVFMDEGAEIEPGTYVDTRTGPVQLGPGVKVEGPARLTGPLFVGAGSIIYGGHVGSSSIGPVCRLRGEVSESVLLGYVNKAHDGYLGHALLGRWMNLGAMTTNSDLKNNYSSVKVWTPDGEMDSGLAKVGCFLGDHVKTGIGTVLNTGSVVGAGSNLFGGIMPPTVVPPFSWGSGADLRDHRLEKFMETAERAMNRRSQVFTPGVRRILEDAWAATAGRRE